MRLITLALVLLSGAALAAPRRALIAARVGAEGPARLGPVEAKLGEVITLYAVLVEGRGRKAIYYTDAPSLRIPRRIKAKQIKPLSALEGLRLRWSQIEPRPHHFETPPPNQGNPAYSNAVLFGASHGKWLGYDTLEYIEAPLEATGGAVRVEEVRASDPWPHRGGLGTMRYQLHAEGPGWALSTPGIEAKDRAGIKAKVFRLSLRDGDDWVSWLTSYFHVPNVFGSAGKGKRHQTDRHQGADCADVITGALRKAGAKVEYSSVTGLYRIARPVSEYIHLSPKGIFALDADGHLGEPLRLRYGVDIKRGDIMVINYAGLPLSKRLWDHVGVVGDDRGELGIFDAQDVVYHMGYLYGLDADTAGGEWPKIVQFLRLKKQITRQLKRARRRRR